MINESNKNIYWIKYHKYKNKYLDLRQGGRTLYTCIERERFGGRTLKLWGPIKIYDRDYYGLTNDGIPPVDFVNRQSSLIDKAVEDLTKTNGILDNIKDQISNEEKRELDYLYPHIFSILKEYIRNNKKYVITGNNSLYVNIPDAMKECFADDEESLDPPAFLLFIPNMLDIESNEYSDLQNWFSNYQILDELWNQINGENALKSIRQK